MLLPSQRRGSDVVRRWYRSITDVAGLFPIRHVPSRLDRQRLRLDRHRPRLQARRRFRDMGRARD